MNSTQETLNKYNASIEEDGTVIIQGASTRMFLQVDKAEIEETAYTVKVSNGKVVVSLFKEVENVHVTIL